MSRRTAPGYTKVLYIISVLHTLQWKMQNKKPPNQTSLLKDYTLYAPGNCQQFLELPFSGDRTGPYSSSKG